MISELFPVLNLVDRWLAGLLPLAVRLSIWGALAGLFSMIIYAKLSPQASIAKLKTKIRSLQREMLRLDLKFVDFLRLSRPMAVHMKSVVPASMFFLNILVIASTR
jgi:replicative DNA helicase